MWIEFKKKDRHQRGHKLRGEKEIEGKKEENWAMPVTISLKNRK
jgi:hypothetical protein